jgi:hypothetical protein
LNDDAYGDGDSSLGAQINWHWIVASSVPDVLMSWDIILQKGICVKCRQYCVLRIAYRLGIGGIALAKTGLPCYHDKHER